MRIDIFKVLFLFIFIIAATIDLDVRVKAKIKLPKLTLPRPRPRPRGRAKGKFQLRSILLFYAINSPSFLRLMSDPIGPIPHLLIPASSS